MCKHLGLAAFLAVACVCDCVAQGDAFPNKPMRWVVPFAPGGGTDVVVRPIAQKFSERVGQSILYDNRGGGGGVIAGEIVARAIPDGYTLLVAAVAVMTVNISLMKLPFDPVKDFAPITNFATVPNMLAARASLPVNSLQELVAYARANPGKLVWAQSGLGSGGHLSAEMFRMATGIDVIRVFYKGAGPANVALLTSPVRQPRCVHAAYQGGAPARACRGEPAAHRGIARAFYICRVGLPRFRIGLLVRPRRAGGNATGDHCAVAQGIGECARPDRHHRTAHARRGVPGRQHAAGVRGANPQRHRKMGECDQNGRHQTLTRRRQNIDTIWG